jgi:hypothetical protein
VALWEVLLKTIPGFNFDHSNENVAKLAALLGKLVQESAAAHGLRAGTIIRGILEEALAQHERTRLAAEYRMPANTCLLDYAGRMLLALTTVQSWAGR